MCQPLMAQTATPPAFHFRRTYWGMSKDEVKKTEDEKPVKEERAMLAYSTIVAKRKMLVAYYFTAAGQLAKARYAVLEEHTNKNDFIEDYLALKASLIDKYGHPASDTTDWRNDLYKDDEAQHGFAVSLGHLVYEATWETKTTDIDLQLFGDNYEIHLFADYTSKVFGPTLRREQKEKEKEEF
jgi:hypothetical protein